MGKKSRQKTVFRRPIGRVTRDNYQIDFNTIKTEMNLSTFTNSVRTAQ